MIQIGRLKSYFTKTGEKRAAFIPININYNTIDVMFQKVDQDLPKDDAFRTNLFYTVAHHLRGKREFKTWQAQEIIPFDLDGIDLDKIDQYPDIACEALGIDKNKCGIVYSGNGVHILVKVKQWKDKNFIRENKLGYQQLYNRIIEKCEQNHLPITKDTTSWDYARILRLPFTINKKIKDGKEVIKRATLINGNMEEQDLEIPKVDKVNPDLFMAKGSFPHPDKQTILKECQFFQWLQNEPDEVHEPHAYAMLSITGHFDDDNQTSAQLWNAFSSPSINQKNVVEFTEQAITTSGPRTCEGINSIWGKCQGCEHFKKITSPIQLKSPDYIGTQHCGFTLLGPKGGKIRQYNDLLAFFNRKHHYRVVAITSAVYAFNGTHYEVIYDAEIKNFAEQHFTSPVKESERMEFLNMVKANNVINGKDFLEDQQDTVKGKINFKNGVLDIQTGQLSDHSPEYNFFYCLPYNYDQSATAPNFEKFLSDVTLGRQALIDVLTEFMGYCVSGIEYKYTKALVLSGSGKNGKSTFVNVIRDLVGSHNCAAMQITSMNKSPFLASELQHKLVNISEEEPPQCFKDTSLFKTLTGNSEIMVQRKFQTPFMMINKAKMILTYNEIPYISDSSDGIKRRLLIVPFELNLMNSPQLVDVNIAQKLKQELSGIFNMAFEGFKRLEQNERFSEDSTICNAVDEAMMENNSVLRWFKEHYAITDNEGSFGIINEMFNEYRGFMEDEGERFIVGRRKFTIELKNHIGRVAKKKTYVTRKIGGQSTRIFTNIKKIDDEFDF